MRIINPSASFPIFKMGDKRRSFGISSGSAPFVPCPNMNFVDAFALNSSGAYDGMELTVTNNGVGGGAYFGKTLQNWLSATGKISVEFSFDSSTDLSSGNVSIFLTQGVTNVVALQYVCATGELNDINGATLATISPTIGQFKAGFTLDQATGTATYSYKLNNASAPTANASLDVAAGYDNAISTFLVAGSSTPVDGVNVITINAGQAEFVTNVDGTGYCNFPVFNPTQVAGLNFGFDVSDTDTITTDLSGTTPVTADGQLVRFVGDQSANGYNPTQAVDARRATYNTDGTYHWLTYAGTNDINFDLSPLYDGAVGSDNWACFGVRVTATGNRYIIGTTSDDGFSTLFASGLIRPVVDTTAGSIVGSGSTNNIDSDVVVTVEWNRTAGTLKSWINGNLEVNLSGTPADKLAGAAGWLGAGFNATAAEFAGRMYCGFVYTTIPSDAEKANIELWVANKMGKTL